MALFITGSEHAVTASSHDQLNGQQCRHSQSADRCQIVQNCLKITHPHQPISEHKFSAALPDQVQWNEKELSSYKETSKLAKPFGDKYFYKEDSLSSGKESSATFQTSISAFVSLSKRCFIVEDGKNATPKSEKLVQNKPNLLTSAKELFRRLEALHIKVGSILWHTLTTAQKCGQLKFEKSHTKQMSSFEECHTKLMRGQGLLVSSKREMAENVVDSGEPKILKPNEARQMQERDIQFCWAEKWRPKRLGDFIFQKQHACDLQLLVCHRRCPHMIFEGPPGVGKISLVRAMIQEIFQSDEDQADLVTKIVVPIKATSNHIEINLSSLGGYERNVIGLLVNDLHRARLKADLTESTIDYKVIVLREADKLTSDVQHYIHWLMERYQDSCKLIFCCSNANKLRSISSLCKVIHVEPPKNEQIIQVLEHIAEKEGIDLPGPFVKRIAENSEKNLRQAIRSLEACTRSQYPFTENQKILTGWEDDIAKIAKDIVEEQSPKQLYNIRGKLQNLILHNVCPNFVFTTLVEELEQYLDDNLQSKLHYIYSAYSGNSFNDGEPLTKNRRDQDRVVHAKRIAYLYVKIEEFTAKFMSVYKDMKMRYTKENQNQFQIVSD